MAAAPISVAAGAAAVAALGGSVDAPWLAAASAGWLAASLAAHGLDGRDGERPGAARHAQHEGLRKVRPGRLLATMLPASAGALLLALRLALPFGEQGATGGLPPSLTSARGPFSAVVESVGSPSRGQQTAVLRLEVGNVRCAATLPAYPELAPGDTIRWQGRLEDRPATSYGEWLEGRGIAGLCRATGLTVEHGDNSWRGWLDALRRGSGDGLELVLPQPEAGLAEGILVGLRERVDRDVAASFTTAGVSHIVAISGWNIAVVAGAIGAILAGSPRRRRSLATILAIAGYTLFAGASPSVVRAALMAGVALLGREAGGASRASVVLAWAIVAMLLADPAVVADAGFQLSTAATAGLIAWGTQVAGWLERRTPWLPGTIRESLAVSLAAQAATLPLILLTFGRLSPVSPVVNLMAVPLVPPVMAAGAVALAAGWLATLAGASGLGALGALATAAAMPAWLLLAALITVVRTGAAVPGASLGLDPPLNALAAALAAAPVAVASWRLRRRVKRRRAAEARPPVSRPARVPSRLVRPRVALALGLPLALAALVVARQPDGRVRIDVFDVGQGDAILVEGDRGSRLLVDGGPDPASLMRALDSRLPAWDRRIDAIVLSHPHDDHAGGLPVVLERYRVGRVFEPGMPGRGPAYEAWQRAVAERDLVDGRLATGDTLRLDGVVLRVLWPDPGTSQASSDDGRVVNDDSIVLLGEYGSERFLLSGDIQDDLEPTLVGRGLPRVDVLKVAHHGSGTSSSEAFLEATRPGLAVVSVGLGNPYGHPSTATLRRLAGTSRAVLRTDQAGSVEATLDGRGLSVTTASAALGPDPSGGAAVAAVLGPASSRGAAAAAARSSDPHLGPSFRASRLLYDGQDVRTRSPRERGPVALRRSAAVAPPPLTRRGRGRRVARRARGGGWRVARPPPDRIGRAAPRFRQGPARPSRGREPPAR